MRVASLSITVGLAKETGFVELAAPLNVAEIYVPGTGCIVLDNCISEELMKQIEGELLARAHEKVGRSYPVKPGINASQDTVC